MDLAYDRVLIEETGFIDLGKSPGLVSTWSLGEKHRQKEPRRVGVVRHIGLETSEVAIGMKVLYDIKRTRDIFIDGKVFRQIREIDIEGKYQEEVTP